MNKYFLACILMFLLFFINVFEVHASTNVLSNCSQSVVNNAVSAASDGDTIVCPSGTWSWTSSVTISNKNITLQGGGIDKTIINVDGSGTPAIYVPSSNTKSWRITGFTFHSRVLLGEDHGDGIIRNLSTGTGGNGNGWRIDHNKFLIYSDRINWDGGNAIVARGSIGLVDHNEFRDSPNSPSGGCWHSAVYMSGPGTGESQWALPTGQISKGNAMFVEDNIMEETKSVCSYHNGHTIDAGPGIYVFRHNTVTNLNTDAHGMGVNLGTREYEISNNDFYITNSDALWANVEIRGGTGVIYNNVNHGPGTAGAPLWMVEYNAPGCSYPCEMQVGRGQNQTSDKLYIWGNTGDFRIENSNPSHIQPGRDYVLNGGAKPGYTAYPYPHPMVGGGGGNSIPNPPTNIRVN